METQAVSLAVAGHAGIGHTHCPGGLIQDDSVGFAVACSIIRDVLKADTRVHSVEVDPDHNTIEITTIDGGKGRATPRRGVTPSEATLIRGGRRRRCRSLPDPRHPGAGPDVRTGRDGDARRLAGSSGQCRR